jgi:hypothetical protein
MDLFRSAAAATRFLNPNPNAEAASFFYTFPYTFSR